MNQSNTSTRQTRDVPDPKPNTPPLDKPIPSRISPTPTPNSNSNSTPLPLPLPIPHTYTTIKKGESWLASFKSHPPDHPSQILPGLYLGNSKTAAAYLLHQVDETYPRISRILTIMTDRDGYAVFPDDDEEEGEGEGKTGILRMRIEKRDAIDVNILEVFDKTCKFIHEGVLAYTQGMKKERQTVVGRDEKDGVVGPDTMSPDTNTATASGTCTSVGRQSPSQHSGAPGGVLVHCHAGVSRSATLVIAYLLKHHPELISAYNTTIPNTCVDTTLTQKQNGTFVAQAIRFVQSKRGIVDPSPAFRGQLRFYYEDFECSLVDERGEFKGVYLDWWDWWDEEMGGAVRNTGNEGAGKRMDMEKKGEDNRRWRWFGRLRGGRGK